MCVLCMFYVDWGLEGRKKLRVGIFLNKNLVRVGSQDFFRANLKGKAVDSITNRLVSVDHRCTR